MGEKLSCCQKKETFGMDQSKFEKTYSPIFAPFLISVVVKLINDTGERSLNLEDFVAKWGGGIRLLRKCTRKKKLDPNDKHCDWDSLVAKCVMATPISHNVWIQLLQYNKINVSTNAIQNLENLLMHWVENGHKYRTYGPYPKAPEQELYIQDTIPPRISEILNYAIINDVFEASYRAMEDYKKRNRIRKSITGDERQHAQIQSGSVDPDDVEMGRIDPDTPDLPPKTMKERAQEMDIRPTDKESIKIHWCLWFGIFLIALLYIAVMVMGGNQYMVMSWMNYSEENSGFWYQDWGYSGSTTADNTKNGVPLAPNLFNSARIQNDINWLIVITFILVLIFLFTIICVLAARIKEKKGYYFYLGPVKVPQRPLVYVLFEMITILSIFLVIMFTMLLIYGMVELIPWARQNCSEDGTDTECRAIVFPVPHAGYFILLFVPFMMSCWIYKYSAQLDYKLDYKTMRIYYPEHYGKLAANPQGIYLYDLLDGMSVLRKLLLFMLFALSLQQSGMIMWVQVTDTGNNSSSEALLKPLGLGNQQEYPDGGSWVQAGTSFNVFIPIFMILHFILLCYFIFVFLRWRVQKILKYIFLLLITLEIVIWFILGLVFYFDFNTYWNKNELGQKLTDIKGDIEEADDNSSGGKEYNYWLPDYGIILHIVIWCYMLKLWYRITKAL